MGLSLAVENTPEAPDWSPVFDTIIISTSFDHRLDEHAKCCLVWSVKIAEYLCHRFCLSTLFPSVVLTLGPLARRLLSNITYGGLGTPQKLWVKPQRLQHCLQLCHAGIILLISIRARENQTEFLLILTGWGLDFPETLPWSCHKTSSTNPHGGFYSSHLRSGCCWINIYAGLSQTNRGSAHSKSEKIKC